MTERSASLACACLVGFGLFASSGCGPKPAQVPDAGPMAVCSSRKSQRQSLAVTVYNQNFGLVRDTRKVPLGQGKVELSFHDVAAHVQPDSVHIESLHKAHELGVLEQNYRYDALTPGKLLENYVGRRVSVYRDNEVTGQEERKDAEVVSATGGVVLRIDGQLTSDYGGRFGLPELPPGLVSEPTLVWLLASGEPTPTLEVSYLTQNLNWHADYVLTLDGAKTHADLDGWVTLDNQSGESYENATVKLVAGDVQRLALARLESERAQVGEEILGLAGNTKHEPLFEYHSYELPRLTSVLDRERKQVRLLGASKVAVRKKLVFLGADAFLPGLAGPGPRQKVRTFLELVNTAENQLGIPLPKGTVRVYQSAAFSAELVGESRIDHTPRDEVVRIELGASFAVVGDRAQLSWTSLGRCLGEGEYRIELENREGEPQTVELVEPAAGDWSIVRASQPVEKVDARTFRFVVAVPARGLTRVSYRIRVRFC